MLRWIGRLNTWTNDPTNPKRCTCPRSSRVSIRNRAVCYYTASNGYFFDTARVFKGLEKYVEKPNLLRVLGFLFILLQGFLLFYPCLKQVSLQLSCLRFLSCRCVHELCF